MKIRSLSIEDLQRPETLSLLAGYLASVVLAIGVGYLIGHGSWRMVTVVAVLTMSIFAAVWLQKRVWILICFGWLLSGKLLVLPLPFAVHDLLILLALFSYLGHRAISGRSVRVGWNLTGALLAVNILYIAFAFLLHPVGLEAFGSETIGGRPYLSIGLALVGYWLLVRLPDSVKSVSRIPYYFLAAASVVSGMQLLVILFPPLTRYVYGFYSEIDTSAYVTAVTGREVLTRLKGLSPFGLYMVLVLCSYYQPGTLFDPRRGRFYALLAAGVCILASGFRNYLLWSMAAMAISGWLHRAWRELTVAAVAGTILLGVLSFGQGRFYELPQGIQRTLCFLPGQWSTGVIEDARASSEWRFQLWREIIEWHLIKDWWFGDGFGANAKILREFFAVGRGGQGAADQFTIETGSYHSGPLTTIRYVGIIGLILLYILTISAAIYSYKTVQRCRGTPLFPVAVFLAMQLIWDPVHFAFVFGGYDGYLPDTIILLGILRLLIHFCDQGFVVPARASTAAPAAVSVAAGASA